MCRQAILELVHSPYRAHRVHGEHDYRAHLDDELNEIGPQHGPHAGPGRICNRYYEADPDRYYLSGNIESQKVDVAETERDREDLDHRLGNPAKDYQVDRDGQVERTKPT